MHRIIFACYFRTRILQGLMIEVWCRRWPISLKIVKFGVVSCVIYLLIVFSNKCTTQPKNPKGFIKNSPHFSNLKQWNELKDTSISAVFLEIGLNASFFRPGAEAVRRKSSCFLFKVGILFLFTLLTFSFTHQIFITLVSLQLFFVLCRIKKLKNKQQKFHCVVIIIKKIHNSNVMTSSIIKYNYNHNLYYLSSI